jgi:hypothetical protein
VIVTIAAWLYILDAVLMLGSLLLSPWGFNGVEGLVTLALAGLLGAMGIGLLKRLHWARWLALGSSLLGWVLGSLLLLVVLGYLLMAAPAVMYLTTLFAGGIFSFISAIVIFGLLLWIAGVVISYKLFWFLCSEQGCNEFGVPHGSTQTVIASCGAWVGIFVLNIMASGGGQAMNAMMAGHQESQVEAGAQDSELTAEERDYAERRARSEAMLREQAELEAAQAAGIDAQPEPAEESDEAGSTEPPEAAPAENYAIEESAVPAMETSPAVAEDSEEESPTTILKCKDASGGIIFTQGYCPPGSKPVRTPANP